VGFPPPSTGPPFGSQDVHRGSPIPACTNRASRCKVKSEDCVGADAFVRPRERSERPKRTAYAEEPQLRDEDAHLIKAPVQVCPLCEGTGWKAVSAGGRSINDRRVTRCDCQLRARSESLLAAARIPRRYEHCELTNYDTDFPGAHPSLAEAHFVAFNFAKKCDPRGDKGLLIIGTIGTGKTHLAVGIIKELIVTRGIPCLFYDYRELLKEIQNSYNSTVQTTELDVLRPVFETDILVLDELGAVKPTEWVWDTVSLILNTRYNNNRTTIITTNFEDQPAAAVTGSLSPARAASRTETLGDRIGERMRSRLHEMCRVVTLDGTDFRQKFRSANFR
jgi:DNA replication protein DnaC